MENLHNFTRGAAINDYAAKRYMTPMSNEAIARVAPSVFAEHPHASRSDRYAYIPTFKVLDALRSEGFVPVKAQQSVARLEDKRNFTKHMLTFTQQGAVPARVGDSIPQISLVNSHDGTSAYKLFAGLHRLVCSNGLLVCDGEFDSLSVHHTGDIKGRVIDASFEVIDQAVKAGERVTEWKTIPLSPPEQQILARGALALRFDGNDEGKLPVTEAQVLAPRRYEDQASDLWTVFNRVQENVLRGGQRYRQRNGRRMTTRGVNGIDQGNNLNRALWRLAEEMKTLKTAS